MAIFGIFLDLAHSLGLVNSSNLVWRHPNTSADVLEGLYVVQSDEITIISLWGRPKNTIFHLKMAIFGIFLDLAHSLGLVYSSNLVRRHPNTSADVVEGVYVVQSDQITIISLWGRPKNTRFRLKNAIFGTFLDLAHSLGLVKSSNLVQRHPSTSADVVEGVYVVQSDEITIISLWGRPKIQKN